MDHTLTIGRIVIVRRQANDPQNNGSAEAPAVITRVWNPQGTINVTVFWDANSPTYITSIQHQDVAPSVSHAWRWPDETPKPIEAQ